MAVYKKDDVLYLLKKAGYVYIDNDAGSHQGYRNLKTGIDQPVAIHGKDLNSHTTESIISYVVFTSYICGEDPEKYKNLSSSIEMPLYNFFGLSIKFLLPVSIIT